MEDEGQLLQGGLGDLVSMVLGGLVGASPHMVSACVMALARLLHEFASELGGAAPRLLPTVVLLLRSKSREIVKSVLGFIKVNPIFLFRCASPGPFMLSWKDVGCHTIN